MITLDEALRRQRVLTNGRALAVSLLLLSAALSMMSGCLEEEKVKEVSLKGSLETGEVSRDIGDEDVVYFGFDLRLSPKEDARIYTPLMRYLSEETGYTFKIRFTADYESTQENLAKGVTRFAALGAVSYLKAYEADGVEILVRGLNTEGKGEYRAIIFTAPDSDIEHIEDIKGRSFAFGSRDSTQGHLIPRKMLDDAGISLDDMDYEYTGSHRNAVEEVIDGHFDAGGAQDTLVRAIAGEGKIRIIKESRYYPSSGIAANRDVDPELVEAVKRALLEFDPKGVHKDALVDWEKTEMPNGFTGASDEDYAELKELMIEYGFME